MQQAATWTGPRVLGVEPAGGAALAGLISRGPALPTTREGARVSEGGDRSRVERARSGDPEAYADLFRSYEPDVRRLCRRLLGDATAAEDATSEAFLRVQRALASYDAERPFRTWLLSVAANHCIDVLRRRSTEKRLFGEHDFATADLGDPAPSPLHQVMRAQERERILAAIDALPVKLRLPLVLRHFAELEYEAIAGLLDLSRNQVGTLLLRARRQLRADLGGRPE